jgi:alanyl-tRNA synthetase
MASERLYYDDSYTTRFEGAIVSSSRHAGRPAIELESTYFYPESGGQEADRGTLGGLAVVDVQADDDGRVWHVLERSLEGESLAISGEVDWARRFDHMQQHTGQHILSAALERVLDAPTLSSHLGEERSSLEVGLADVSWESIARVEDAANGSCGRTADRPSG